MNDNPKFEAFKTSCRKLSAKIASKHDPAIADTYVYEDSEMWAVCKFTTSEGSNLTIRCFDYFELDSHDVSILMDTYSPSLDLTSLYCFAVKNWSYPENQLAEL